MAMNSTDANNEWPEYDLPSGQMILSQKLSLHNNCAPYKSAKFLKGAI